MMLTREQRRIQRKLITILGGFQQGSFFSKRSIPNLFEHNNRDAIDHIDRAQTPEELLAAVMEQEQVIIQDLNNILKEYQYAELQKGKFNIPERQFNAIKFYFDALRNINLQLIENFETLFDLTKYPAINELSRYFEISVPRLFEETIGHQNPEEAKESNKKSEVFLRGIYNTILLALLKVTHKSEGLVLINVLRQSLKKKGHTLKITWQYMSRPGSMKVEAGGIEAYAELLVDKNEIKHRSGTPSFFCAPVWSKELTDKAYHNNLGVYFNVHTLRDAIEPLLDGSLSFGVGQYAFFTPTFVGILHELIHVLHNSQGNNLANIWALSSIDKMHWHNIEEYKTISGGECKENILNIEFGEEECTENAINAAFGFPERFGHGGLAVSEFLKCAKVVSEEKKVKVAAESSEDGPSLSNLVIWQ